MGIKKLLTKQNLLILTPLILVMVADFVFTTIGQPPAFWQDPGFVREGNPIARYFLVWHYGWFTLVSFAYGFLVLFLILKLKRPFNVILAVFLFISHGAASSSWMPRMVEVFTGTYPLDDVWFYSKLSYYIFVAVISGLCINKWLKIKDTKI